MRSRLRRRRQSLVAPLDRSVAFALAVALLVVPGCDGPEDPASPADLTGAWSFSFVATDPTAPCPPAPGLVAGCAGGGELDLVQWGPSVSGTWQWAGGCQDCAGAGDFAGSGALEPTPSIGTLAFAIHGFEFRADVPGGDVETITGTVSCPPWGDRVFHGTFQMTRQD